MVTPLTRKRKKRSIRPGPALVSPFTVLPPSTGRVEQPAPADTEKRDTSFPCFEEFIKLKNMNCHLSISGHVMADSDFWNRLLDNKIGWLSSQHLNWWLLRALKLRAPSAPWTLMPAEFLPQLAKNPTFDGMVNGTLSPYPSWTTIDNVLFPFNIDDSHWMAVVLDLRSWSVTIYDSMRNRRSMQKISTKVKSFSGCLNELVVKHGIIRSTDVRPRDGLLKVTHDMDCIQQSSGSGDCGVFTCMFLTTIALQGVEAIPRMTADNQACRVAKDYRMYMAKELYMLRVHEQKRPRNKGTVPPGEHVMPVE